MNYGRTNQVVINQVSHSPGDAIGLGTKVLSYTIKNQSDSTANLFIGLNEDANSGNMLEPGESLTIQVPEFCLDDNLYLAFDTSVTTTGGRALVIIIRDTNKEVC